MSRLVTRAYLSPMSVSSTNCLCRWKLTYDRADWHPYNPNAEYEARLEAEGRYTDPLHQAAVHDEPETPPVAPDFDL